MARTNTEYERLALEGRINLSDGHARHDLMADEVQVVRDFPAIWEAASKASQNEVEAAFTDSFFGLAGQDSQRAEREARYFSYSASCSILIAAQVARSMNQTIYLLEPTFDNIYHLLRSQGLTIYPVQQSQVEPEWIRQNLEPGSVLWLTLPNNPTGFTLDESKFSDVASAVSSAGCSITIDFAYRFFCSDLYLWDQYEELERQGVEYIGIEDTGKTWATADFKAGLLACSEGFSRLAHKFHDELLLNVSPVGLKLVRRFIEISRARGGSDFVRGRVEAAREMVHLSLLEAGFLHMTDTCANVPLELFSLPCGSSVDFWSHLRAEGVEILPAHNYYWSSSEPPSDQFRIPLTRPISELSAAMGSMRVVASRLESRRVE